MNRKNTTVIIIVILMECMLNIKGTGVTAGNIDQSAITHQYKMDAALQIVAVLGDLDKDGVDEKIIVCDTDRETDFGTERVIQIYKNKNKKGKWKLWHTSTGAVLPSAHGGMMGDPFQEISVENGCIVIRHFGGSRQKWSYTHRYRFQKNNWKLIGATIFFGAPCDYWCSVDYNLSTGNIHYKKQTEICSEDDNEMEVKPVTTTYSIKPDKLPDMDGFYPGDNEVKLSKDLSFYY